MKTTQSSAVTLKRLPLRPRCRLGRRRGRDWLSMMLLTIALAGCEVDDSGTVFPATNRPDIRGTRGAVASDQPLATAVGLDVLRRGGNAMDAAIAMAGVLAVVRPHMNGVGGDAFGLYYEASTGTVHALDGSGRSGAKATPDFFREAGHTVVPELGPMSVSVPGAVSAWETALGRFGTWAMADVLSPAVHYASEGFPVSTRLAADFAAQGGALNGPGRALYLPGGSPPAAGSLLKNEALGITLRKIGEGGQAAFYRGEIGQRLATFIDSVGGALVVEDFQEHRSNWVTPLVGDVHGFRVHAMPPSTQGMAQLALATMAGEYDMEAMGHNSVEYLHTFIELKKLAFADRNAWASDPTFTDLPIDRLLDSSYLAERSRLVDPAKAATQVSAGIQSVTPSPEDDLPNDNGDTVYITVVDQWGNGVSWIQSLFHGFGSGLLEPETGVVLHNRGSLYTLEEDHPNIVAPGKRPYHTLSPLLALNRDGSLAFTLGTPGGDSQPQSLLQIINNLTLFGMTPQAAVEAPRFRSYPGVALDVEDRIPASVLAGLSSLGHEVNVIHGWTAIFGGAQMIYIEPGTKTLTVAADPRREAYGLAY